MLLSVRCPRLLVGARPIARRGRSCVAQAIAPSGKPPLEDSALGLYALDVDDQTLNRLLTARDPDSIAEVIITEFPELHQPIKQLAQQTLDEPILVHYKGDGSKTVMMPRSRLFRASTSCAAVQEFLKQQLGIAAQHKVEVTFSRRDTPGEAVEFELTDQVLEQRPMAYIVGFADDWFVSDV